MNKHELLRLNLQHFSEKESEEETNIDETEASDETENTEETGVDNQRIPYDRFKAKVDEANALKEKLAEIERQQEEAKRKELEETEQYKELYEQALKQAEQAKQEALNIKKNALLTQAGYKQEQAKLLIRLVEGDDEQAISESIDKLKTTFPVKEKYVDPSPLNGGRDSVKTVGADEVGVSAFERIKNKIF